MSKPSGSDTARFRDSSVMGLSLSLSKELETLITLV